MSHPTSEAVGPSTSAAPAVAVCHLIASNFAGGPEKQIVESSARLQARGWPVVVASFREGRDTVEITERARERGLPTFLVDTASGFSPDAVRQLRRAMREHHTQVLVTHGYKANLVGWLATRTGSVIQIPVVRGYTGEDAKVRVYEAIDRALLRRMRRVFTVSSATRDMLLRVGVAPERVTVVHNSVDCERQVTAKDLHAEFGIAPASRVIVAAGRLSPEKAHRDLVDAMATLVEGGVDAVAVVLGDGKEEAALREQIDRLGLRERVLLAGFRRDVLECLAGADLVVNPSHTEGLPNVVLEAMAVGTAVVATDVGGVRELILPERTGWLVPARRPAELAAAMAEALTDDARRSAMARGGREHVVADFSFTGQVDRFVEHVGRIVAERAR